MKHGKMVERESDWSSQSSDHTPSIVVHEGCPVIETLTETCREMDDYTEMETIRGVVRIRKTKNYRCNDCGEIGEIEGVFSMRDS